jgi:hypothetical protein
MEYDRHILSSNNVMRMSWKLINKEFSQDCKNHGVPSLNIDGRSITNHQIIANAFNNLQLSLPQSVEKLMPITVLPQLLIIRITFPFP